MVLALDIGNTNIVIGCFQENKILFVSRIATDRLKTEDEYAITFISIFNMNNIDIKDIKGSIISSVVPPLVNTIKSAVLKLTGKKPMIVSPGLKTGLNIAIDNPAQLGSDLVVNAVAGINEYPKPLIIIDMGTASTISVIDEKNNYLGGVIMPGVNVSQEALISRTSQLMKISLEPPKNVIGKNTIDCMKSGAIFANSAMIDGMIDRIEKEIKSKATVIATGGLSSCIIPYCEKDIIYDSNLLLKGLCLIYYKNI